MVVFESVYDLGKSGILGYLLSLYGLPKIGLDDLRIEVVATLSYLEVDAASLVASSIVVVQPGVEPEPVVLTPVPGQTAAAEQPRLVDSEPVEPVEPGSELESVLVLDLDSELAAECLVPEPGSELGPELDSGLGPELDSGLVVEHELGPEPDYELASELALDFELAVERPVFGLVPELVVELEPVLGPVLGPELGHGLEPEPEPVGLVPHASEV